MSVMGRRRAGRQGGGDRLTVSEAAALWNVARSTVYNWIDSGLLTCFESHRLDGGETARRADVFAARVLRVRELRALGFSERDIAQAVRARGLAKDAQALARFSLDDIAAIRAPVGAQPPPDAPRRLRASGIILKTSLESEVERERAWVARGADPSELDDDYFDCEEPPALKTPPGVFLYEYGNPVNPAENKPGARYVRRTAGWDYVDGKLAWFEADDRFAVLKAGERLRPEWVLSSQLYRTAHRIWLCVWTRRSRRRRTP